MKQALNQISMRCNLQVLQEVVQMRKGDLAATQRFVEQQAEVSMSLKQAAERQVEASEQFLAVATSAEKMYSAEATRLGEAGKVRPGVLPLHLQVAHGHIYIPAQLDAENKLL